MCGVWVALEDVTLAQGRLHYYPGSQRLPHLDYEDLGIPLPPAPFDWNNPLTLPSYLQYEDHIERIVREAGLPRVDLEIRRGSFFVWAANLHHRGGPVLFEKIRGAYRIHPVTSAIGRTTWRAQRSSAGRS
jgi:ectoine hydroxylase-related dioxygenase (phytanoyl-CoA dioxygenase family)